MTDTLNGSQGTEGDQGDAGDQSGNIKLLRDKAARADQAEAEALAAKRELAIFRSGIDTDSPAGKLFLKAYDGDPTDVDAMTAAAKEYEVPFKGQTAEAGAEGSDTGTQEAEDQGNQLTGSAERRELANGAGADTGESPDPRQVATDRFREAQTRGATEEAGLADFVATLGAAAQAGDPRVTLDRTGRSRQ